MSVRHWKPAQAFRLYADFQRQNRDGIDITGGSSFTQAALLPRWIDYETDQIDAGIQYGTDRASLTLAWYGSYFTNQNPSLTWDTPFTSAPGQDQYRMAMAPDNDFQQVSLSGAYRLAQWDTVVAFTLASGSGEQNEPLLPYTNNPAVGAGALPQSSLDGKVDTANYAFTVTSRPLPKGRIKFAYRFDERDNKTLQVATGIASSPTFSFPAISNRTFPTVSNDRRSASAANSSSGKTSGFPRVANARK